VTAPVELTDPDDPRFDDFRDLRRAPGQPRATPGGTVVVEGALAVGRLCTSRYPVRSVLTTPARVGAVPGVPDGAEVLVAPREVLAQVCGFDVHRGVLASADRLPTPTVEQVAAAHRLVVVEGVGDPENLGALFRTAAALGVGGVLLDGRTGDPLSRRAVRVSLGWSLHVPWCRVGPLPQALADLSAAGVRTVALTPADDAVDVDVAAGAGLLDGRVALVLGAEGDGLARASLAAADHRVRIPMAGDVDSLNVATAFGVVAAFAAARAGWDGVRPT